MQSRDSIRVLVVDDSALMRKLIPQLIEHDRSIHVVGTAMDGDFALRKIEELKPDVITLDLAMPRMNGMDTLKQIMRDCPTPVVVVSAHSTDGARATFKALHMGAFDFVAKPVDVLSSGMNEIGDELIAKIRAAVNSPVLHRPFPSGREVSIAKRPKSAVRTPASAVVAIGVSTGGPNSLEYMLSQLPAEFSGALVVVQHMPPGFTGAFAKRLNECCRLDVKEAQSGDLLSAGQVLLCPGDRHVRVRRMPIGDVAVLSDDAKVNGHRPSVDVLFRSVAAEFAQGAVGVLMTGMGEDGAEGLGAMKAAGAMTIAQDEASSVVFGMPRAAIERGYAQRVLPLESIANTLLAHCGEIRPQGKEPLSVRNTGQM
jgi:two-component system chemotaxis response regulator CheB